MSKIDDKLFKLKNIIPTILIIVGIILYIAIGEDFSVDKIINMSPTNRLVASFFILLLYLLKSISIIPPIMALYIVSGMIFPIYWAIPLNVLGVAIGLTYSYRIGYSSGEILKNSILTKYEKLNEFYAVLVDNEWFSAFIIRIVGILPHDVVNMFFGSIQMPYYKYMTASIFGLMPMLTLSTIIGKTITDPTSIEFILAVTMRIILSIAASIVYRIIVNRSKKTKKGGLI